MAPLPVSYVLPLRSSDDAAWPDLARYLNATAGIVAEVIVADGSPPPHFERHRLELAPAVRHIAPHPDLTFAMGKVNGVASGIREATNEAVVVADDDVRWTSKGLMEAMRLLDGADLVRPQNYFEPIVWHARLDTGRILLNRALPAGPGEPAADFPGTLVLRRSTFMATNGYDGDALFENLEQIRTMRAAGGRVEDALGLYVARRPPSASHYRSQRVRQAYDDFALPARMATWLSMLPALAVLGRRRRRALAWAWVAITAAAELGRRREGGARVFPVSSSLLAPLWVIERAVCSWLALRDRLLFGGVRYGDARLRHAATPQRKLDERYGPCRAARTVAGAGDDAGALSASKPISL